jgi:hypothetical protein
VQKLSHIAFSKTATKDNGGPSCENNKIGNKSFPASRNVTMSLRFCILPVTGNYIFELIILIILKSSLRQRFGYIYSQANIVSAMK